MAVLRWRLSPERLERDSTMSILWQLLSFPDGTGGALIHSWWSGDLSMTLPPTQPDILADFLQLYGVGSCVSQDAQD